MESVDDISLIVTGCIKPNNKQPLFLKDSEVRLCQYVNALRFYIGESKFKNIIFCDNSGFTDERITRLRDYAIEKGKGFEFISFVGNEDLIVRFTNKGVGEAEIMDRVFSDSSLLKTSYGFFKVTGRLVVENINIIIESTEKKRASFLRYAYGGPRWLDTRLYYMPCYLYREKISSCYDRCGNYSLALEKVYYRLVNRYRGFKFYPKFKGVSGGNGYNYSTMPKTEYDIYNLLCRMGLYNFIFPLLYCYKVIAFRLGRLRALPKKHSL